MPDTRERTAARAQRARRGSTSEPRALRRARSRCSSSLITCQPPFVLLRECLQATGLWGRVVQGSVLLESPEVPETMWRLDADRTCVLCAEDACGVGTEVLHANSYVLGPAVINTHPTGILCECADCVMDEVLAGTA
jgi:hypothetical protein